MRIAGGAWHHVALTLDRAAGLVRFYVDGQLSGTGPLLFTPVSASTGSFCIGGPSGSQRFNGAIDEVMLDDRALTPKRNQGAGRRLLPRHGGGGEAQPRAGDALRDDGDTRPEDLLYGRNLSHSAGTTDGWIYIKPVGSIGQWATVTSVNPYKIDFTVPAGLANWTQRHLRPRRVSVFSRA